MKLGAPYVHARSQSDYWLYSKLFSSTCPVALIGGHVAGAVIAFRSQENLQEVYVQDVMVHPAHRNKGIAKQLMGKIQQKANEWSCTLVWLTSEAENIAAHSLWTSTGFRNIAGDQVVGDISVITNFKGMGKHRAVYELFLQN
jgi:GNAT superfamily N-acetyltransferase